VGAASWHPATRGSGACAPIGSRAQALTEKDPTLLEDLERLVDGELRGDPEQPLRWTAKSLRNLAGKLRAHGHVDGLEDRYGDLESGF
jgi:hypothetical protein